jgi:hypothetical protein
LKSIEILVSNCAEIGVQLSDERDHMRWQRLGSTSGQLGRLDKQWRNDYLLMECQLAADLVEQLDRLLPQSLKVRIFSMVAWPQERNERRRGRDRQRPGIVFGQKCLDAGEQRVIGEPLLPRMRRTCARARSSDHGGGRRRFRLRRCVPTV